MVTSKDCYAKYGPPETERHMTVWLMPESLQIGAVPKRIYCNRDLVSPLSRALRNVKDRNLQYQIQTWDGCFNIRRTRGGHSTSLHAWGIAIDINAAWNGFGKPPTMSTELVACFTEAGFDWGGLFQTQDGMHFQLAQI
jgi:hypothetical protein